MSSKKLNEETYNKVEHGGQDIGRKRGRNFELSEQESRKKQKNEYDIFFPKETYCNKKGKNPKELSSQFRSSYHFRWSIEPSSCMKKNYPPLKIWNYIIKNLRQVESKFIVCRVYYDPRTGFCDFNPCMSETSWDGEVISDTMERGLDEEFKTEIDRRLSFPEIVNERRGRQEFGFSVAEISELRRIDSIKKSNEKKGNDDRSRKAIVYIVSDDITQASNFCRSWDPYIQSTQSERENCVGVGLLHLSEVLDCWKEMGCPF